MLNDNWAQDQDARSSDASEPPLRRVVEEALDFASSTGLCEVQGILPHLPGAAAGGYAEPAASHQTG